MNKIVLAAVLIGLTFVPISGAMSEGNLQVDSLDIDGASSTWGHFDLFHADGSMPFDLTGPAGQVLVEHFTRSEYVFQEPLGNVDDVSNCMVVDGQLQCHDVQTSYFEQATLEGGAGDSYAVQAFAFGGTAELGQQVGSLQVRHAPSAVLIGGSGQSDVEEDPAATGSAQPGPNQPSFTTRAVADDVLIGSAPQMATTVLRGSFVLELIGAHIDVTTAQGTTTFESGEEFEAQPTPKMTTKFTRLYIEDGEITLTQKGGSMSWAQRSMDVASDDAEVTLRDATGLLYIDGVEKRLQGDTEVISGPMDMSLDADDGAAATALRGKQFEPASSATVGDMVQGTWAYVLGAAGLLAAIVVGMAVRRKPALSSIEALLEGGDYSKAAKLASRAIRREPTKESVHLARAIAWSRDGKQEHVIANLGRFIRTNDPSDGTLHYVLGLAHRELGQESKARVAMEEAVRRTPALLAQIGSPGGNDMHAHAYT